MTQYVKATSFSSKDALLQGNPLKIVKGTEIDTEFNNIATAVATKADLLSPVFTGTPLADTAASGTSTTQLATTAFTAVAVSTAVAAIDRLTTSTTAGTAWTIIQAGTKLNFSYGGVVVFSMDSSGNVIAKANVTAYGTP